MKKAFCILFSFCCYLYLPAQISTWIDMGTTISIPYKWQIEKLTYMENYPRTLYTPDLGYFFEFLLSNSLGKKYAIDAGINYRFISYNINHRIGLIENKGVQTNSYITIPVLICYHFTSKVPVSVSAGPYLGFILMADEKGTTYIDTSGFINYEPDPFIESIEPVQKYNNNIKECFKLIDYGLVFQLDYKYKRNKRIIGMLFSRFNLGIPNVLSDDGGYYNSSANKWKNYNLVIGIGLTPKIKTSKINKIQARKMKCL